MFKFLNKNLILQSILFIGLLGYSVFLIFNGLEFYIPEGAPVLSTSLYALATNYPLLMQVVVTCVLLSQLALLQYFFGKNDFSESFQLSPSIWYMAYLAGSGCLTHLSPLFFINLLIIILLLLNANYDMASIKSRVLVSGILIGIAFFIDIVCALLIVFIIIALIVNRFSKAKDILVSIFGFSIPVIYFFCYYLFTDQLSIITDSFLQLRFFGFYHSFPALSVINIIGFILLVVMLLYLMVLLRVIFANKLIVMRRRLITLDVMTIVLFFIIMLSPDHYPGVLLYLFIPVSVYCSLISQHKRHWLLHDIVMLTVLILLCL